MINFPAPPNPQIMGVYVNKFMGGTGSLQNILADAYTVGGRCDTFLAWCQLYNMKYLPLYEQDTNVGPSISAGSGLTTGDGYFVIGASVNHNAVTYTAGQTFLAANNTFTGAGTVRKLGTRLSNDDETFFSGYKTALAHFIIKARTYGITQVSLVGVCQYSSTTRYDGTLVYRAFLDYNLTRINVNERVQFGNTETEYWNWDNADLVTVPPGTISGVAGSTNLTGIGTAFNSLTRNQFILFAGQVRQIIQINSNTSIRVDRPFTASFGPIATGSWKYGSSSSGSVPFDMYEYRMRNVTTLFRASLPSADLLLESYNGFPDDVTHYWKLAPVFDRFNIHDYVLVPRYNQMYNRIRGNPTSTFAMANYRTGTVSQASLSTTVNGIGTLFTVELMAGCTIAINGMQRKVVNILSDVALIVDSPFTSGIAGGTKYGVFVRCLAILSAEDTNSAGSGANFSGFWLAGKNSAGVASFAAKHPMEGYKMLATSGYVATPAQTTPAFNDETAGTEADLRNNFSLEGVLWFKQSLMRAITLATPLTITATGIGESLCGTATGGVTITTSAGTANYTFAILDSGGNPYTGTGATQAGLVYTVSSILPVGNYTAIVTDAAGRMGSVPFTIPLNGPAITAVDVSTQNVSCNGGNNGDIGVNSVTGGVGPYTYQLNGGGYSSTLHWPDQIAGSYTINVKDANNCVFTKIVIITQPNSITLTGTMTPGNCSGGGGSVTLVAGGGTAPYLYKVGAGSFQSSPIFSGLTAGAKVFTVQDNNGCNTTFGITVTASVGFTAVITGAPVASICSTGVGTYTLGITPSGGTGPYTYLWNTGETTATITGSSAVGSHAYSCTIMDAGGCTATANTSYDISVNDLPEPVTSVVGGLKRCSTTNVIHLEIDNASEYSFFDWDELFINNGAGSAFIEFTESQIGAQFFTNGGNTLVIHGRAYDADLLCSKEYVFTLNRPNALTLAIAKTDATCANTYTGSATPTVGGGRPGYIYEWTAAGGFHSFAPALSGIQTGIYHLVVTDADGCSISDDITINQSSPVEANLDITQPNCIGTAAQAHVTPSGGTGPYTILWDDGTTLDSNINLLAGSHWVKVTDANGCFVQEAFTINTTVPAIANIQGGNPTTHSSNDGWAQVLMVGGSGLFTYEWDNGQTGNVISGLIEGTYTVTITDANGCTYTKTIELLGAEEVVYTACQVRIHNAMCCAAVLAGQVAIADQIGDKKEFDCLMCQLQTLNALIWVVNNAGECYTGYCLTEEQEDHVWSLIKAICPNCGCS